MNYGFKPLKPFELNISKAVRDKLVKRINAIMTAKKLKLYFYFENYNLFLVIIDC